MLLWIGYLLLAVVMLTWIQTTHSSDLAAVVQHNGFTDIGIRRGYYQPSGTDALVMRRISELPPLVNNRNSELPLVNKKHLGGRHRGRRGK